MSRAEQFIQENTKRYNNLAHLVNSDGNAWEENTPWLTPNQARRAVEIAREEILQDVKRKLLNMLNTSVDNKHFFEQLDEYIDELENKQ